MFNEFRSRYLSGRWLVLLVAVPVLAGLVAGYRAAGGSHTAAGKVSVAQVLVGESAPADQVDQLVALFETAFESDETADETARALGAGSGDLRGRLRHIEVGSLGLRAEGERGRCECHNLLHDQTPRIRRFVRRPKSWIVWNHEREWLKPA